MKILPNHKERIQLINQAAASSQAEKESSHNRIIAWRPDTGIVHTFVGGSDLHGASVGSDDLDIYGVFIERPEFALGIHGNKWETFQWSTSDETRKNTKDDVDVCVHSLRKWANLASTGNPTILHFLFTPLVHDTMWEWVASERHLFLAKSHVNAFLGYADQQMKRLNGKLATNTNRPELVAKYGFDTKMAMHMIRLMFECEELLLDGKITLPNPRRSDLINIRLGQFTLEEVNGWYDILRVSCQYQEQRSMLPATTDRVAISKLIAECYRQHWRGEEENDENR